MRKGMAKPAVFLCLSCFSLAGGAAFAAEFEVLDRLSVDGYSVLRGSADISGSGFSVGGSAFVVRSGNVGIGTAAPFSVLEVLKTVNGAVSPATSGTADPTVVSRFHYGTVGLDIGVLDGGSGFIQNRNVSNLAANYSLLLNPNGGNVGIGTTAPAAKLEITGISGAGNAGDFPVNIQGGEYTESDLYILNSRSLNAGVGFAAKVLGVNIQNAVGSANQVYLRSNNGGITSAGAIYLGPDNVNQGIFGILGTPDTTAPGTALNEYFTVKGGGNIGIGTTAPADRFHVAGESRLQPSSGSGYGRSQIIPMVSVKSAYGYNVWGNYFTPPVYTSGEITIGAVNASAAYGYMAKLYWSFGGTDRMLLAEEKLGATKLDWRLNGDTIQVMDTYNYDTQIVGYVTYLKQ